ncbi:hypothetical protein Droror1_Dr00003023 [Drosera rotundifolia]
MSVLAGRLAAKEGAYFLDQSKQAITRLAPRATTTTTPPPATITSPPSADVLPEVLRHSLPPSIIRGGGDHVAARSSISGSARWSFRVGESGVGSSVSADALNPLRGFVAMPQVTFGPRRWELPQAGGLVTASTANELRRDQHAHVDTKKLKDVAEGLAQIGKAFAAATAIIFGGAVFAFGLAASKLEIHSSDDIRTKGKEIVQPKLEAFKERFNPLRNWAENTSKRWRVKVDHDVKEKAIIKELSKNLGARS